MEDFNLSQELGHEIAHILSDYLLANDSAIKYLENRGIKRELIEQERVGYCPPFLNYYWAPLMKGRITVTISDAHSNIISFAGRQFEPSAKYAIESLRRSYRDDIIEAEKKVSQWMRGKWINEVYPKKKHLYNLDHAKDYIRDWGFVIIVEGYFDALVLESMGFYNTVALCGAKLSERHATLLSRYCDRVVILLDGDAAGEKGTANMLPILEDTELKSHCIYLPAGYDPDTFVKYVGAKKFMRVIDTIIEEDKRELKINLS